MDNASITSDRSFVALVSREFHEAAFNLFKKRWWQGTVVASPVV